MVGGSQSKKARYYKNHLIRFGIFDRDDSQPYAFKLLGYITLNREDWYDNLLQDGILSPKGGAQFNVRRQ